MKKVTVVVLNWNGLSDTLECLDSLRQSDYPALETIVVDNGSTDGSVAAIRDRFPEVAVIENGSNLGFVKGNNIGLRAGLARGADFLFVLNNDTVLRPDCVSELVAALESAERDGALRVGIVGPLMKRTLRPDLIDMGGDLNFWTGTVHLRHFASLRSAEMAAAGFQEIDYVWGCGLMVRAEVLKAVGLFDARYVAYYEDADFCMRARAAGYRTVVATRAWMIHQVGRSGEKRFLWQTWMRLRNHFLFFLSYARPYQWIPLLLALVFYQMPWMMLQTARLYLARKFMPRYRERRISLLYRPRR